jgi:hypothetical protein
MICSSTHESIGLERNESIGLERNETKMCIGRYLKRKLAFYHSPILNHDQRKPGVSRAPAKGLYP